MSPTLLITGGSRGIGAATAILAARRGWDVAVNYTRDAAAAERVAAQVRAARPARAGRSRPTWPTRPRCWPCSPRSTASSARCAAWSTTPAWSTCPARVDEMSAAAPDAHVRHQRDRARSCARARPCKRMSTTPRRRGRRRSSTCRRPRPGWARPASTSTTRRPRARIDTFTLGLAREVATEGIRVNAVRPGIIDTDIHASGGLPDRVQQTGADGADAARRQRRRGGAGHRLAAVGRVELHHRRRHRRHRRALSIDSSRSVARRRARPRSSADTVLGHQAIQGHARDAQLLGGEADVLARRLQSLPKWHGVRHSCALHPAGTRDDFSSSCSRPRSAGRIHLPSASTMARRMRLMSSRTLPGQS